jgi:hypothetical protein
MGFRLAASLIEGATDCSCKIKIYLPSMKLKSLICFSIGLLFAFVAFGHPAKDFVATNKTISYTSCFQSRWADEIFVRHYFTDTIVRPLDVLIHEMMIDPSPMVGLPNFEWIELKNNATHAINLKGYRLGYGSVRADQCLIIFYCLIVWSSYAAAIQQLYCIY